jgi:hypothetical protein
MTSKSEAKRIEVQKKVVHLPVERAKRLPLPATWGDCQRTQQFMDCDVARCHYNLRWEWTKDGLQRTKATESCTLAVAERGPQDYTALGRILGASRQRMFFVLHGIDKTREGRVMHTPGILDKVRADAEKLGCTYVAREYWEESEDRGAWDPFEGSLE